MKIGVEVSSYVLAEFTYEYTDHRGESFDLDFLDISLDHPFFSDFVQRLLDKVRPNESSPRINGKISLPNPDSGIEDELQKQICVSNFIVCLIELPDGRFYFGTNGIENKQEFCTTDILNLDHYGPCKSETLCKQKGHGEMVAIANWLMGNGYMNYEQYLSVHRKRENGEPSHVLDHVLMIEFIEKNGLVDIFLGKDIKIYLQGHSKCCKECAEALYKLGARVIYSSRESHKIEKDNRRSVHEAFFKRHPSANIGIEAYLSNVAIEA